MIGCIIMGKSDPYHYNNMKTFKRITLHDVRINLGEGQAKDLSRVRMRIFQDDPTNPSARSHTTKQYAEISGNQLRWSEDFIFRYQGQRSIVFQTFCEYEFGYRLQELQVLYRGQYMVDNDKFFRRDSCPVYSPEGERKGDLQWEVRVQKREQNAGEQQQGEVAGPLVRLDLIALIKIEEMALETVSPSFNVGKYSALQVRVKFGEQCWSHLCGGGRWRFRQMRLQWVRDGAQIIEFEVASEGRVLMSGSAACEAMQKIKRYTKYKVALSNRSGVKLCNLLLEYRLVQKKQLLDLLYSPRPKLNYDKQSQSLNLQNHAKKHSPSRQRSFFLPKERRSRYQIGYLMNRNSDILLPKAARFPSSDRPTPFSYLDPHRCSDFSPVSGRGWVMGRGGKSDFTRQFRGNPGVGSYELPSIWSKY